MTTVPDFDRRQHERRTTPPMACETICKPVDDKLDEIWEGVKSRPTTLTFYLILSGFGALLIVLLGFLWSMKGEITTVGNQSLTLLGNVEVVKTQLNANAQTLQTFTTLIDRENQRQDSRIQRLEDRIESLHKGERQ